MKTLKFLTTLSFVFLLPLLAFGQLDELNGALQDQQNNLQSIAKTVKTYVFIIGGVCMMIFLGTSLFGGRDGDDKIKKFGNTMMIIGLFLIGIAVIAQIFGI